MGSGSVVGMGSIVESVVGSRSVVGMGSIVGSRSVVESGSIVGFMGFPSALNRLRPDRRIRPDSTVTSSVVLLSAEEGVLPIREVMRGWMGAGARSPGTLTQSARARPTRRSTTDNPHNWPDCVARVASQLTDGTE